MGSCQNRVMGEAGEWELDSEAGILPRALKGCSHRCCSEWLLVGKGLRSALWRSGHGILDFLGGKRML